MAPIPPDAEEFPPIHLRVHPLTHRGSSYFLSTFTDAGNTLLALCTDIMEILYPTRKNAPDIHSITIYIRPMEGVAYTTGNMIDPLAKEIHFSADYILDKSFEELSGVLIHELVHVWQRNGKGTAPGGFVEGLADYVRLTAGLGAAHWKKAKPGENQKWDAGYERTAWFLEYVEGLNAGWLERVNRRLKDEEWGNWVWQEVGANGVDELWKAYVATYDGKPRDDSGPPPAVPTHVPQI